jgi:transposase
MVQRKAAPVRQSASDRKLVADARRAHQLRETGMSYSEICKVLGRPKSTVGAWLRKPMPTDTRLKQASGDGKRSDHKLYLRGELDERFRAEAIRQGCSRSQIAAMAIQFYLDGMDRYRNGDVGELHLYGFRH